MASLNLYSSSSGHRNVARLYCSLLSCACNVGTLLVLCIDDIRQRVLQTRFRVQHSREQKYCCLRNRLHSHIPQQASGGHLPHEALHHEVVYGVRRHASRRISTESHTAAMLNRYRVAGRWQPLSFASPRLPPQLSAEPGNSSWWNKHSIYTHTSPLLANIVCFSLGNKNSSGSHTAQQELLVRLQPSCVPQD